MLLHRGGSCCLFFTVNESHVELSERKHMCLVHFSDFLIRSMNRIETIITKF